MWTGQEMTLMDSLQISVVGLLVVFAALASLAIAIIIISKVLNAIIKTDAPQAAAVAAAPVPAIDEESYAVLLAAVSEEARLSGEEFRVTSIKEL
jgi:Na+-transporting methylmalonyl-CoA/oxaloacetate decarboxylase gamma subunit